MHKTVLRKVGGSVMLAVPPAILDLLQLRPGSMVDLGIDGGRLVIDPRPKAQYSLEALLADCDPSVEVSHDERDWLEAPPVGSELL